MRLSLCTAASHPCISIGLCRVPAGVAHVTKPCSCWCCPRDQAAHASDRAAEQAGLEKVLSNLAEIEANAMKVAKALQDGEKVPDELVQVRVCSGRVD